MRGVVTAALGEGGLHCVPVKMLPMMLWNDCDCYYLTFQGWMNQIQDYDPETYHPALTHSVFATLEGSHLCLDTPRTNISRRAMHDEKVLDATFVKSRSFQLAKSRV